MALFRRAVVAWAVLTFVPAASPAPATLAQEKPQASVTRPFAVEYSYKVKWGQFDEFMQLHKRNHYPILQRFQS